MLYDTFNVENIVFVLLFVNSLLVSMAPLSNEIRPVSSCTPQHIGPAIPEVRYHHLINTK